VDPKKAYKTFYKYRNKLNFVLLLIIFLQVLVLFISINGIKIPNSFLNAFITSPKDNALSFKGVYFKLPKMINAEKIELISKNNYIVQLVDPTIISKDYIPSSFESFLKFKASIIECTFLKSKKIISLKNITANVERNYLQMSFEVNSENTVIKAKGKINLTKILNNTKKQKGSLDSIFTNIEKYNNLIHQKLLEINTTNNIELICVFDIDENIKFNIVQKTSNDTDPFILGLRSTGSFDLTKGRIKRISTQIEKLRVPFSNSTVEFNKSNIFLSDTKGNQKDSAINYLVNCNSNSINFEGVIKGSTSNLFLNLNYYDEYLNTILILDNNSSNCSNFIKWNPENSIFSIDGFNNFIPDLLDFKIIKNDKSLNLFTGDAIKVCMDSFSKTIEPQFNNFITIIGNNVSVLDSPNGNYEGTGTINDNLSITFSNLYGKMGDTVVNGTYSQEWNPLNYEFVLNGQCNPTDINNWMGEWWTEIWTDFVFNLDDVPLGEFIISGSWGGESNHSTDGKIDASNYIYKQLDVINSKIHINVDDKKTTLSLNHLEHSKGLIGGHVSIPRIAARQSELLSFKMNGDFPLKDGKKILGGFVESFLDDFNLTTISVDTHGDIDIWSNKYNSPETSDNHFHIVADTDKNGSWNGINFTSFKGTIKKETNSLLFDFPTIQTCNGNISLLIDSNLTSKNSVINLKTSNLKVNELFNSITSYQLKTDKIILSDTDSTSISENGIVDFSVNATCTDFDFTSLNGTGKIKIKDKELSKIRLLGLLSNGLDELPLPFPSGTLRFNKLEGLFEVENGLITFDRIVLSGLLSKVVSNGNIDLKNGELSIISKIQLIGNVPIISKIAQIADPLAVFAEIKMTGPWNDPKWEFLLTPTK
jgi:hypothetical protein